MYLCLYPHLLLIIYEYCYYFSYIYKDFKERGLTCYFGPVTQDQANHRLSVQLAELIWCSGMNADTVYMCVN